MKRRYSLFRVLPLMVPLLLGLNIAKAAVFTVTNTNDTGPGSLRQAILDANAAGTGPHSIDFAVYGQITIFSSLPLITAGDLTIDGENKITINSNGLNQIINPFNINANNVTVRNFTLTNSGDLYFSLSPNTTGVTIEDIQTYSTVGSYLNGFLAVNGNSTNLTVRDITCSDVETCQGGEAWPYRVGRAFIFFGGQHNNLVMDNIRLRTLNNATGCEGVVFRDASVNGWTLTNSDIRGFRNGIVLDNTAGAVETGKNILVNHVTVDSFCSGIALGFYSDFVDSNIVIRNTMIDQDIPGTTDDGDHNIRFDNAATAVVLDSVTTTGTDGYTIWFNGTASNIRITNSSVDCADGEGTTQLVRFESTVTDLVIRNTVLNADRPGTADDGDHGLVFLGATTNTTLDSLTVNECDIDGIYVSAASTNFQLSNSKFTSNFDGIEFYNNVARSNVDIVSSSFMNGGRSGIVINGANAATDVDITGDTVTGSVSHGIWFYGGAGITDVLVSGNVIRNNGGAGINNDAPNKVVITNNSIYNNTGLGIANPAGNCAYTAAASRTPVLVSSTAMGAGQYQLQITIPNITAGAVYDVDIYANDPAVTVSSGQTYVTTLTGLSSGTSSHTITWNGSPAGFWTATLRIPLNNCGTSEFSDKMAISPQGPGNVDANVKLWLRADAGLTSNGFAPATDGQVVNRWNDFSQGGAPNGITSVGTNAWKKAGINFNPAAYFNGTGAFQAATPGALTPWINTPAYTSFAVFNQYTTAADGSRLYVMYDQASAGFDYTTNQESLVFARNGANVQTHRGNAWETPAVPNAFGRPGLFTSVTNATSHSMRYNGVNLGSTAYSKGNIHAEQWFVGAGYANGWCCGTTADVAEIITYDRELTAAEITQVQSYLALKYGIGKTGNYVASDGTTIYWDSTANTVYNRHVTGVGRDDSTFLLQKQSLSADTGIVTLALGAAVAADNASNTGTIGTDKSFFVFGDNGAAAAYTTAVSGADVNQRMARVWKVQKTAWTDQNITLKIKGAGASNYLLIGSDPTFATIAQELQLDVTGSITLNSNQLANGIYFTVGARVQGPSFVNTGIAMWLRADDGGASGTQWSDFSGLGSSATQATAANMATVLPAGVNFNPALKFDGINDYLSASSIFTATGVNNAQIYAVTTTDGIQNHALFAELVSNGQSVLAHVPWGDGNLYWDAPFSYRAQAAWGGRIGAPFLWSFLRSPSNMTAYRNKTSTAVFNAVMNNIAGNGSPFFVGSGNSTSQYFNGKIAELIVYNNSSATTATQRQQVESYLALKYGLTLSPASPVDYLSSDSTVKMWTAASNIGFGRHITGIGRDSVNMLNQKQSISADTGFVIVSLGSDTSATNAANPNTITNDKSFLVFGDNGAALSFTRAVAGLTDVNVSIARTWKVQKTGWADQNITFVTDNSMAMPQYLLISTDTTFGAGDIALPMTTGKITLNSSQLPNGAYFTFGNKLKAPGAVTAGIRTWYRADDMTAGSSSWFDFSGNDVIASQTVIASRPTFLQSALNYNPAFNFNGTQFFRFDGTRMPVGISARTVMLVTSNATSGWAFSYGHPDPASFGGRYNLAIGNGGRALEISNSQYGNNAGNTFTPNITSLAHAQNTSNAASQVTVNGSGPIPWAFQLVGNQTLNTLSYPNGYLGGTVFNNAGGSYTGRIGEVVVYDKVLTAAEKNRVESYLALKYGITLDQTTPVDYTASDSVTKMWTASANTGYNRRITGIGRDDSDSLNQKQSLSVDTGIVAIALGDTIVGANTANTAVITTNLSFFVFGDNGAPAKYLTQVTGLTGINARMSRVFKVDKTNWADQDVTLALTGGDAQTYLVVSSDPGFGAGDAMYALDAGGNVTLNSSALADGAYFTFAIFVKGPNTVTKGLNFWLRADDGTSSGSSWSDYSGHGNDALQATVASQPATDAKGINFNYSLRFDGANDFLDINTTRVHPDSATIFVAGSGSGFAAVRDLVSSGAVGSAHGMEFRLSSASGGLQWLENAASVAGIAGAKPYVENRPYLFSGTQNNLANGIKLYQNYGFDIQGTINLSPLTANLVSIGSRTIAARGLFWQGNISEVIVYDRVLPDAERQLVESYLGLKYGITLNNGATAYLASDSTVYWAADATYKNRITGIGRDDSTALNTKQSLAVDTGFVTVALGGSIALTNEQNTASVTNDRSFLVFADNGSSTTDYNNPVSGVNATQRISRVWKVDKTNWVDQNITLKASVTGSDNYLLISTDPTFATLNQELPLSAAGVITLNSSLLTDGVYFTFGRPVVAPGCVATPVLWLKANEGITANGSGQVSAWADASGTGNTAAQATAASQPLAVAAGMNFNPAVDFDGANDFVTSPLNINPPGADPVTAFTVYNADALSANNRALWGNDNGSFDRFMKLEFVSGNEADVAYAGGNITGKPIINSAVMDDGAANGSFVYINGLQAANFTQANSAGGTPTTNIGNWGTAGYFDGKITEQIFYNRSLSSTELRQVNTYLAIKYGITAAHDYLATGATDTLWHVTSADSAYKSNIAGIWRQDCSALYQKQSRSVNDTNEVIIAATSVAATNAANTGSLDNGNFLVWGANGTAAYTFNGTFDGAASRRLNRVWKVRDNGNAGQVQLAIPKAALLAAGVPGACEAYKLLVSNTATDPGTAWDATNATEYTLSEQTINGVTCYATTLSFAADADRYFTIGRLLDKGAHPYLVADGSVTAAADECETSDWIYFLDPLDDTRRILAIKKNGNTIDEDDFTAKVDVSTSYATPSNSPLGKALTTYNQPAVFLMRRLVEINFTPQVGHSIDTAVYVRMYWDDGSVALNEKQMARDNLNTLIADSGITVSGSAVFEWFKAGDQDIASTLANMNATGVYADSNGSQKWSEAPDADHVYGIDGSLPYVEFRNVTSFSTFGGGWFVNQTDNSILPVELLSFNAWKEGGKVRLAWEVANQQNVRGYRIQRSPDGANWTEIGFVAAKPGSGKLQYASYDQAPLNGRNYYRLRQEDNSGTGKYSEVRLVNFSNGLFDVSLHPVPVARVLGATVDAGAEEEVVLTVTDVLGRTMQQQRETVKPGRNLFYLHVSPLSPGTYVLDISGTKHSWKGKFIKASE